MLYLIFSIFEKKNTVFKINKFFIFSVLLLIALNSCGKYEDGPALSFTSKENRLCRTWILEKINHSNGYSTDEFYLKLKLGKDKSSQFEYKTSSNVNISFATNWEWLLGTYGLTLNFGSLPQGLPSGLRNFEIKRLTKKELWIEDRGSLINYHFKSE